MKMLSHFFASAAVLSAITAPTFALTPLPPVGTTQTDIAPVKTDIHKETHKEMREEMRKEMHEAMNARWEKADTDKDGQISKAEAQAANMNILLKHFDAADTNKDGKISHIEMKAWMHLEMKKHASTGAHAWHHKSDKHDTNNDPEYEKHAEHEHHHDMTFKTPAERHAEHMSHIMKADIDKDGQISKTEAQSANMMPLLQHFDEIDTNKDGKLSVEELNSRWESHRTNQAAEHAK